MTLVELCAGSAALTFHLLGGEPPCGYLGGKRRYAASIAAALGLDRVPDRIVLVEIGPWGRALRTLRLDAYAVAGAIENLADGAQGRDLFKALATTAPPRYDVPWTATFLMLQGSCVLTKPVTSTAAGWRTSGYAALSPTAVRQGFKERLSLVRLARRVRALPALDRVEVIESDCRAVEPISGAVVYIDPPYPGHTGYGRDFANVVEVAERWAAVGARVGVSGTVALSPRVVSLAPSGMWQQRSNATTEILSLFGDP